MRRAILLLAVLLSCVPAAAWEWGSGYSDGSPSASDVRANTSAFDNNLSSADNTVQKALNTLDELAAGGAPEGTAVLSTGEVGGTKFLREDGDGTSSWQTVSAGISNVVEDITPQLGGSLDVNGQTITSATNGDVVLAPNGAGTLDLSAGSGGVDISTTAGNSNITLAPHGTGNVLLGNFTLDADQTVGAGQDNYVLTYDNAGGLISLEAAGGGGIGGSTGSTDNAMLRADGTGGATAQAAPIIVGDYGSLTIGDGTNNNDVTITIDKTGNSAGNNDPYIKMDVSENTWEIRAAGVDSAYTAYRRVIDAKAAVTDAGGYYSFSGNGARGYSVFLGADTIGAFVTGHWSGSNGCGFAMSGTTINPVTTAYSFVASPALNNGSIDFGSSSYRWNNVYSEAGNFSGQVDVSSLKLTPVAVSALGTATAGLVKMVSDAADATDCTTGSGSTYNLCIANGSAWIDA